MFINTEIYFFHYFKNATKPKIITTNINKTIPVPNDIQRGEVSTSGHFNYEQDDGYDFIYESLDDKGYINIIKHSTKQKDCIKLYFYQ